MKNLITLFLLIICLNANGQITKAQQLSPNIKAQKSFHCTKGGFTVILTNFKQGGSSVTFKGHQYLNMNVREIASWRPFHPNTEYYKKYQAPNEANQICLKDGFYVGPGEYYYNIKKENPNSWKSTQVTIINSVEIGIYGYNSASEVLNIYKTRLEQNSNGVAIPSYCSDINQCSSGSGGVTNYGDVPGQSGEMNRLSIADLAANNPFLETFDAIRLWKGQGNGWGDSVEDINGLTSNWITTLNNLGIINGDAIKNQILNNHTSGNFIFKKLTPTKISTLELLPIEEEEELHLIIRPKISLPAYYAGQCLAWPTCLYNTKQSAPRNIVTHNSGRPNPYYCEENDPTSDSYIPMYISDSDVLLELLAEVEYLTVNQLDAVKNKGIDLWDVLLEKSDEEINNAVSENPSKLRIKYDCILPTSTNSIEVSNSSTKSRIRDEVLTSNDRKKEKCKLKDIAYYDALIERMIIVNPQIGTLKNHPCNKPKSIKVDKQIKPLIKESTKLKTNGSRTIIKNRKQ